MKRREFLQASSLLLLAQLLPIRPAVAATSRPGRTLILLELKGGNDGLNTLVPYEDPHYYRARPNLAVAREQVLQLGSGLGLNPALKPLLPLWQAGELTWVQGLGYPQPNRSHFRSIEIWDSGSDADRVLETGWLAGPLADLSRPGIKGLVVGQGAGPLYRADRVLSMANPGRFLRRALKQTALPVRSDNPALAHLLRIHNETLEAARELSVRLKGVDAGAGDFPKSRIGRELQLVARLLLAGIDVPVIKLSHGSFDTHQGQRATQDRLLKELAEALAALRNALIGGGRWQDVMVASYSEFGRRVGENGSRGTDHGTASVQWVAGGRVRGGIIGDTPSLTNLAAGDLRHTNDFRSYWASLQEQWLKIPAGGRFPTGRFPRLDLVRSSA